MSSVIDEIKTRIDIVDLVSETVQLRHSGRNYTGYCPFHSNTRTPAFAVFPETGTWRCFGQCNEGGDIFGYVMKKEGWDFSEALRYLADKAGVQLKPPTPQEQAAAEEGDHLRALLEEAVAFYRHQLLNTPAGNSALGYLRQRGLQDAIIEAFGLGYAPDSWEAISTHFISRGYQEKDLLDAGLVSERDLGGVHDRFRHRVMFPIRDERGRMAGFGARILDPEDVPKFLNSPQTQIFDKGRLLYGLERARKSIRSQDQAVIVEGYLDVVALHQAGYTNAISPMGTALTEHQLYLLKKLTRRIVLALDSDAAGDKATLRGLQMARQALDHESDPVFDARGLLGYEARLQADIRVTTLPEGMDPDDIVNRDAQEWQRILEAARPVVMHVMETLAAGQDLDDPKAKSEIAAQVLPLIQDVPSPVERDTYRQRLARLLRVDESALMSEPVAARRPPQRRTAPPRGEQKPKLELVQSPAAGNYALEAYALGVLLRRPDLLYRVDREMQKFGLARLAPTDFLHADHQAILRLLQESIAQDMAEPLNYILNNLSLPMMEVADDLLARTEKMDPSDERVLSDLLRALLDLRSRNLRQDIEYLRHLMVDAQQQGDLRVEQYRQTMLHHATALQRLDQARGHYTSRALHSH
ncbi:MAG: DNA primase [Chloroflexi bacterium RBG_16_52_11]|nr:MAG: DNA primase [Chloroflexi bacterium RBG_16_52_11]